MVNAFNGAKDGEGALNAADVIARRWTKK